MSDQTTVGQYLVDRLLELGLRHLFSIPGDYTIGWMDRYVTPSEIKVISEVNELNAGYAADGYARQKGQNGIGALCVTYSAGALSAANPIAGAYAERVPVVLINGAPSIKKTLAFEQTGYSAHHFISGRQTDLQVFEYITAAAVRVDDPHLAPMQIDYALTQCITERRPVYIELLEDMVDLNCESPTVKLKPAKMKSDGGVLIASIEKVKAALESAARPLIWLGAEIDRFGLEKQAKALIEQLNIPYVTQLMSKAVLPENDPYFIGVFVGKSSSDTVQDLVRDSDFILALGVWLTDINTLGWPPDIDKTAFVSFGTVKFGTYFGPQVSLEDFMEGLLAAGISPRSEPLPQLPGDAGCKIGLDQRITYQGFYDFIPKYITDRTIVGADASLNYFGSLLLKVTAARGYFSQSSYSSIGYIAPAATGICLARASDQKVPDQRVMVFTGDGGYQMTAFCVATQTRFKLNPIIFVMDNGVFAVEQWLADASVFKSSTDKFKDGLDVHRCSYFKMSEVVGCMGRRVTTYGELETAINEALTKDDIPSIIHVELEPKSIPKNAEWKALIDGIHGGGS
ncbi:thiamine pyrophosphate-binding protein [Bradyrhizobium sp. Arg237L]|uniref:alpha-keto acid decarboxylase family protein n=1 Tax=Bradyrhizobium sp. Arg237L TaxID=3003352 RepID=UPI00249E6734|nr:thiamine pyrophosphate-binding protein [Bradyrhizobium sp. Arg237L]MDI4232502.1 thiamine pyrophosphate-binding protein [Bradyrhizobium sp. Arg237L]